VQKLVSNLNMHDMPEIRVYTKKPEISFGQEGRNVLEPDLSWPFNCNKSPPPNQQKIIAQAVL